MNIRTFLAKFRTWFIEGRIYFSRSVAYLSLINAGMILFLFLAKLKEANIVNWNIGDSFFTLYIVGTILLILFGWFEIKYFKGYQTESNKNFALTPSFVELKEKVDYLFEKEKAREQKV